MRKGQGGKVPAQQLKIKQTATGYWVVERGAVQLAGAMTRRAAEAERDLFNRLRLRSVTRLRAPRTERAARLRDAARRRERH
jgi:hypothetical protein